MPLIKRGRSMGIQIAASVYPGLILKITQLHWLTNSNYSGLKGWPSATHASTVPSEMYGCLNGCITIALIPLNRSRGEALAGMSLRDLTEMRYRLDRDLMEACQRFK